MSYLQCFDVAKELGSLCVFGPYRGNTVRLKLSQRIAEVAAPMVWNVTFANSEGIEYGFAGTFLGPILDQCGENIGQDNVVVVISGKTSGDRTRLLKGLVWQEGDKKFPPEQEWLRVIAQKQRYCIFRPPLSQSAAVSLDYLGTTEKELLDLLAFLEGVPEADVNDVEQALKWKTSDAVHRLEELNRRRQVLLVSPQTQNDRYMSIAQILKQGDKHD